MSLAVAILVDVSHSALKYISKNNMNIFSVIIEFILLLGLFSVVESIPGSSKQDVQPVYGITGGKVTSIKRHPYQVSIFNKKMVHMCSGVIVEQYWILTSALCVSQNTARPSTIIIRAGSDHLSHGGQIYRAEKIIIHGSFERTNRQYDFALIKTVQPMKYNKETNMIQYSNKPITKGVVGLVSGWGVDVNKRDKRELKELPVTALDFEDCREHYPKIVSDTMMCVSSTTKNTNGFCDYTAGDAIISNRKLVGIFTSFPECRASKHPAIFSDVSFAAPWMKSIIEYF